MMMMDCGKTEECIKVSQDTRVDKRVKNYLRYFDE